MWFCNSSLRFHIISGFFHNLMRFSRLSECRGTFPAPIRQSRAIWDAWVSPNCSAIPTRHNCTRHLQQTTKQTIKQNHLPPQLTFPIEIWLEVCKLDPKTSNQGLAKQSIGQSDGCRGAFCCKVVGFATNALCSIWPSRWIGRQAPEMATTVRSTHNICIYNII